MQWCVLTSCTLKQWAEVQKMPFVQKNVQFNAAKQRRFNINGSAANRMERRAEGKFLEEVGGHF
jgi:hypothetical protein